jgi:hypothetical protein
MCRLSAIHGSLWGLLPSRKTSVGSGYRPRPKTEPRYENRPVRTSLGKNQADCALRPALGYFIPCLRAFREKRRSVITRLTSERFAKFKNSDMARPGQASTLAEPNAVGVVRRCCSCLPSSRHCSSRSAFSLRDGPASCLGPGRWRHARWSGRLGLPRFGFEPFPSPSIAANMTARRAPLR